MSDENTVRVVLRSDGTVLQEQTDGSYRRVEGRTNWDRIDAMTDEEVLANAISDPDNPPLTDEELERLRRYPNLRRIRERLQMSREEFARAFEIPLWDVTDWEEGIRGLDPIAQTYLRVIERSPDAVIAALAADTSSRTAAEQSAASATAAASAA